VRGTPGPGHPAPGRNVHRDGVVMATSTVPQAPAPDTATAPTTPATFIDLDSLTVTVVGNVQVVHDGTRWVPGETATVPGEVATNWLAAGYVTAD